MFSSQSLNNSCHTCIIILSRSLGDIQFKTTKPWHCRCTHMLIIRNNHVRVHKVLYASIDIHSYDQTISALVHNLLFVEQQHAHNTHFQRKSGPIISNGTAEDHGEGVGEVGSLARHHLLPVRGDPPGVAVLISVRLGWPSFPSVCSLAFSVVCSMVRCTALVQAVVFKKLIVYFQSTLPS